MARRIFNETRIRARARAGLTNAIVKIGQMKPLRALFSFFCARQMLKIPTAAEAVDKAKNNQANNIIHLLGVAVVILLVSLTDSATAQRVDICPGNAVEFNARNIDPHIIPLISEDQCAAGDGSLTITIAIRTGTEGLGNEGRRCGLCREPCGSPFVRYTFRGGPFCGPENQCNAVGGTLANGTVCQCDPGNARNRDGICVLGVTEASNCTEYQELRRYEAGKTEGVCEPREASDCDSATERFAANTEPGGLGGICECAENFEPDGGGSCVACINDSFNRMVSSGGTAQCECPDAETENSNGICTDSHQACYDADFRRPIAIDTSIAYDPANCVEAQDTDVHRDICRTIRQDSTRNFQSGGIVWFTQVFLGSCGRDGDNLCMGTTDNPTYLVHPEVAMAGANVGRCFSETDCLAEGGYPEDRDQMEGGNICRILPSNSMECLGVPGNMQQPIYDDSEPDNCRPSSGDADCAAAGFGLPIRETDGSCRLPNASAECRRINEMEPIHDSSEPDHCRAAASDEECLNIGASFGFLIRDGDSCREPQSGSECRRAMAGNVYDPEALVCKPSCGEGRIGDNNFNCRDIVLADCDSGQYLDDMNVCQNPATGEDCRRMRKEVTGNDMQVYESQDGFDADSDPDGCTNRCVGDREPHDSTYICQNPGQDACTEQMMIAEAGAEHCRFPRNGTECSTATRGALMFYNPGATSGGECVESCQSDDLDREVTDMNNNCRDRELRDCEDNQYLDPGDLTCKNPTTGVHCRERKEAPRGNSDVLEGTTCLDGCNGDRRPNPTTLICQDPMQEQCAANLFADGSGCRVPQNPSECSVATGGGMVLYDDALGCVENCPAEKIVDVSNNCVRCDSGEYLDAGHCRAPTNAAECRAAEGATGREEYFVDRCVEECPTGEADSDNVCVCRLGLYFDEITEICRLPRNGEECRALEGATGQEVHDGSACATACPPDQIADENHNCAISCENGLYFDFAEGSCREPANGTECRRATGAFGGEVYSNGACAERCLAGQSPNGDYDCRRPASSIDDCRDGDVFDSADSECRQPSTGQECRDAKNDTFTGMDRSSCVEECPPERPVLDAATYSCRVLANEVDCSPTHIFVESRSSCVPKTVADCEVGQTFTPAPAGEAGGTCAVPPSSSSDGSGDTASALVAVPFVLIGGYYLLGGGEHVDPTYNFRYSGENEALNYTGNAGFNLSHGGLRSYALAVQSSGNAVAYKSGISYGNEIFDLAYNAHESESDYAYDLGAQVKAEFGLWTIAPTAETNFQYQRETDEWNSDTAAGLSAVWTAHRWQVKAQSDFTGNIQHALDLELQF